MDKNATSLFVDSKNWKKLPITIGDDLTVFPVRPNVCAGCHLTCLPNDKFKACGGCGLVYYHSKKCQTAHYKKHKQFCRTIRAAKEKDQEQKLPELVATRDPVDQGKKCRGCGRKSGSVPWRCCGNCCSVCYCSTKCQTQHYVYHKKWCRIFALTSNDGTEPTTRDCLQAVADIINQLSVLTAETKAEMHHWIDKFIEVHQQELKYEDIWLLRKRQRAIATGDGFVWDTDDFGAPRCLPYSDSEYCRYLGPNDSQVLMLLLKGLAHTSLNAVRFNMGLHGRVPLTVAMVVEQARYMATLVEPVYLEYTDDDFIRYNAPSAEHVFSFKTRARMIIEKEQAAILQESDNNEGSV